MNFKSGEYLKFVGETTRSDGACTDLFCFEKLVRGGTDVLALNLFYLVR